MSGRVERGVVAGRGVTISTIEMIGAVDGPRIMISGNLHGDECTGIGVIHRLIQTLPERLTAGRVRLYPSLNPGGMASGRRGFPGDALDPNRAFPGSTGGTGAQRHAHVAPIETARELEKHVEVPGIPNG